MDTATFVYDIGDVVGWGEDTAAGAAGEWQEGEIIAQQGRGHVLASGLWQDADYTIRTDEGTLVTLGEGKIEVFLFHRIPAAGGAP